tara:strand:- start:63 stop:773 length:711 start_codon:yes stop_codon:yes gene_type:complete
MMKRIEIGPEAQRLYESGHSNAEIADRFNELGLTTARGLVWKDYLVASLPRSGAYWPGKVSPHGHSSAHHLNMTEPPQVLGEIGPWIEEESRRGFNTTQISQQLNFFECRPARSKVWSGHVVASILKNRRKDPDRQCVYFRTPASAQLEIVTPAPVKSADPRSESLRALLLNGSTEPDETTAVEADSMDWDRHRVHCASIVAAGLVQRIDMIDVSGIARTSIEIIAAIEDAQIGTQ